jgi:hypothetical protein
LFVLGMLVAGCLSARARSLPRDGRFNQGTNATWLGVEWCRDPHSRAEVEALAMNLREEQIRDLFVYATYLREDGRFNPTYQAAREFTQALKASGPDFNVQAWIGLPLRVSRPGGPRGWVDFADRRTRQGVAQLCADLVHEYGFSGIHLDPEPAVGDDPALLLLLDEVRAAIGPQATLSIASPRILPLRFAGLAPLANPWAWRPGYYRQVAAHVDQIAFMNYDSALPSAGLYRLWAQGQVTEIVRALAGVDVELFLGIPASEERTFTHQPRAENMALGLQAALDALQRLPGQARQITGVAIYPYWETDAAEWATYEAFWLGKAKSMVGQ